VNQINLARRARSEESRYRSRIYRGMAITV
jgi:hypothetical protein